LLNLLTGALRKLPIVGDMDEQGYAIDQIERNTRTSTALDLANTLEKTF